MRNRVSLYVPVVAACIALTLAFMTSADFQARAQTGSNCRTFPETGKTVCDSFLEYWNTHGGLAQQGYPISEVIPEVSETDGVTYPMQYFERAVFEQHSELAPSYDVLLSLLGVFLYERKYPGGAPGQTVNADADSQLFPETGYHVGGLFLKYWNEHGRVAQQGYPISEEFNEISDLNGQTYKVQYFQRAVFEYHPEQQPPYNVLLSQLGTYRYRQKHESSPTATPNAATPSANPLPTVADPGEPPRISLAEFKALYDNPATRPFIIDVRCCGEYEDGHIKGAISFPEQDLAARVGELPRDKLIVAYCQ
jgi:hypothetical protein